MFEPDGISKDESKNSHGENWADAVTTQKYTVDVGSRQVRSTGIKTEYGVATDERCMQLQLLFVALLCPIITLLVDSKTAMQKSG